MIYLISTVVIDLPIKLIDIRIYRYNFKNVTLELNYVKDKIGVWSVSTNGL